MRRIFSSEAMDLFIHTLTGTIFELRVSPFETILSIKSKVQRLEGISISQQHLIWRSMELEDCFCLHDYGIKSGATLILVLAMRGGPINMRRVSLEEPSSLQEIADYIDENRDELWDKLMSDNKQVTLLVYREGDQLNFFRVYDGGDGTLSPYTDSIREGDQLNFFRVYDGGDGPLSPYTDSISTTSAYNGNDDETPPANKEKQRENLVTKDKMRLLRQQIASKGAKKLPNVQPPPSSLSNLPSANLSKRRIQFAKQSKTALTLPCNITQNRESNSNHSLNIQITPSPMKFSSLSTEEQQSNDGRKGNPNKDSDLTGLINSPDGEVSDSCSLRNLTDHSTTILTPNPPLSKNNRRLPGLHNSSGPSAMPNIEKDDFSHKSTRVKRRGLKPLGTVDKNASSRLLEQMRSPPGPSGGSDTKESHGNSLPRLYPSVANKECYSDGHLDDALKHSQLPDVIRDPVEYENYKNLLNWVHPKSTNEDGEKVPMSSFKTYGEPNGTHSLSKSRRKVPDGRPSSRLRSSKLHAQGNITHLPPVHNDHRNLPTLTGKRKPRCSTCTKKLGLATTYQCRCGSKFCAKHRYPETHTCTYDYKTEGRRLLERSNPVVTAPKLPKI